MWMVVARQNVASWTTTYISPMQMFVMVVNLSKCKETCGLNSIKSSDDKLCIWPKSCSRTTGLGYFYLLVSSERETSNLIVSSSNLSLFSVISHIFSNDRKKLNQFDHNVRKYEPVSTVSVSFNTIMGQMAEMSQWKKNGIQAKETQFDYKIKRGKDAFQLLTLFFERCGLMRVTSSCATSEKRA